MTLDVITRAWPDAWRFFVALPEQHPFYYLLLGGWVALFGTSEVALRSLSALFALATLWVFFLLVREMVGGRAARVSAVLLCVSPFFIYYGQEARMYSLLALLTVAGTLLLLRWSRTGERSALLAYAGIAVLGVYTHFFYIFLMGAHLTFLVVRDRGLTPQVSRLVTMQALVGVLFVPWALLILSGGPNSQDWKGAEHFVFGVPYTLLRFSLGYSEVLANAGWKDSVAALLRDNAGVLALGALAFGVPAAFGVRTLVRGRTEDGTILLLSCLLLPVGAALLLSIVVLLVGERYLMVSFPFYIALLGVGLCSLWDRRASRFTVALLVPVLLALVLGRSLYRYYFSDEFGKEQWAEVAEYLRHEARPADLVLTYSGMTYPALSYYYRPEAQGPKIVPAERLLHRELPPSDRIWLVLSHPAENRELVSLVGTGRQMRLERFFPKNSGIRLMLLERVGAS